jgi:hypothetical protein
MRDEDQSPPGSTIFFLRILEAGWRWKPVSLWCTDHTTINLQLVRWPYFVLILRPDGIPVLGAGDTPPHLSTELPFMLKLLQYRILLQTQRN